MSGAVAWPPRAEDYKLDAFSRDEQRLVRALINRVVYLSELIREAFSSKRPVHYKRLERKAIRFALRELGVTLPPNPVVVGMNDTPSRKFRRVA